VTLPIRVFCLSVLFAACSLLIGCARSAKGPINLKEIRPYLKAEAEMNDVLGRLTRMRGQSHNGESSEMAAKIQVIVLYDLEGPKKGMRLKLAFRTDQKLAAALVVKKGADGKFSEVDETIVAEQ
jgi:hypothetical protein